MTQESLALGARDAVHRAAFISPDGVYRYSLLREWAPGKGHALFVMLNPSTADAEVDDPTIRRCMGFARLWGRGGVSVVNLYALRATDPREIAKHPDPIGPLGDDILEQQACREDVTTVVLAWGPRGEHRGQRVVERLRKHRDLWVLGLTAHGEPRHPLYMPYDAEPFLMWPREAA